MWWHQKLKSRVILKSLIFLSIVQYYANAYPYPNPHPHPRPYPYPVVQAANTQRNQFEQNFDKTQFKPPELEETIEEVQKILQKDPSLPRLTRGEIEELYEKVTREEYQKSIEAGDLGRADSMRALMLVLPYNTDNSTAVENLQELYTLPPVTKVIDGNIKPHPIRFLTHDPNAASRAETTPLGPLAATTYKPNLPLNAGPNPTTYHPRKPAPVTFKLTPATVPETVYDFQPITNPIPQSQLNPQTIKPVQRFSSHYNAKNTDFKKLVAQNKPKTSTVRPVADILETLGIVGQVQSRNRIGIDDYYAAESAPTPIISSYVPLNGAEFDGLRGQSLAPKIRPDAYTSFKPLNIGEEIRVKPEVEDYLTRFGIVGGRKRKALKKSNTKTNSNIEQTGAGTELKSSSIPSGSTDAKKPTSELEKLLENLQELERLNANRKITTTTKTTTPAPTTTTTTRTTPRTTTSTTEAPELSLITNGEPMLIEAQKSRRRIDPHFDLNFASTGNQQPIQTNEDQLTKLLENLQELERLRLNPENVLKSVAPTIKSGRVATKPIKITTTTTPAPKTVSNEQIQLEQLLKQLQGFEEQNAKTTTKKPINLRPTAAPALDLFQLRKLLTDDNELERLYEQARRKVTPKPTTTTSSTTTTTTTPKPFSRDFELEQLQKYFAELDKARSSSSTSTSTTTTTTTTTTTPRPTTTTTTTTTMKKPLPTEDPQIQELLNRVKELEQLNKNQSPKVKSTTESSLPYLGFTSRNIKAPKTAVQATAEDYRVPSNDFAQLQQLYRQVQEADRASFTQVEISTAATASKHHVHNQKNPQDFTEQLIDISNETGSGNSLQTVEPNDFVQLQKLLSKVQELERVKISPNDVGELTKPTPNPNPNPKVVTYAPSLVTAASIQTSTNLQSPSAQIVYPEKSSKNKYVDFLESEAELKLDLPAYKPTQSTSTVSKKAEVIYPTPTSSEELHELAMSKPINPKQSQLDKDFEQYQEFFASLEDAGERNTYRDAYENMEPPKIEKTVTKEPPRFVATKKPHDIVKPKPLSGQQQADLAELQKLLSNAQELEKLGVTLPKTLSDRIESKLSKTTQAVKPTQASKGPIEPEVNIYRDRYGLKPKPLPANNEDSSEKAAVFSLTTPKSVTPKPPKATTDSPLGLPVFSATKIIEAAIKQAANRIGVTTEQPQGFRRRSDDDVDDEDIVDTGDDDMVGEFSEMNYQIAIPEINRMDEGMNLKSEESTTKSMDISKDLGELQRLIGNLQELQRLNVSISSDMLHLADTKYLESFKDKLTTADETNKSRRQSVTPAITSSASTSSSTTENNDDKTETASTTSEATISSTTSTDSVSSTIGTTPTAPTRVTLGIGLGDTDSDVAESGGDKNVESDASSSSTTSTTEETTTTDEPRNGSLADLEASFGPDPNKEEPLPPKKKNGFYFLADWNSFLEVGDGDDQVVVRFSPKIGDPRLFLPVKIP